MSHREQMTSIMRERERLLAQCSAQRIEISALLEHLKGPLKVADKAVAGISYLRRNPLLLGASVAALLVIRRRGWWQWAQRGFMVWRAFRAVSGSRPSA